MFCSRDHHRRHHHHQQQQHHRITPNIVITLKSYPITSLPRLSEDTQNTYRRQKNEEDENQEKTNPKARGVKNKSRKAALIVTVPPRPPTRAFKYNSPEPL